MSEKKLIFGALYLFSFALISYTVFYVGFKEEAIYMVLVLLPLAFYGLKLIVEYVNELKDYNDRY